MWDNRGLEAAGGHYLVMFNDDTTKSAIAVATSNVATKSIRPAVATSERTSGMRLGPVDV